jgi:hypothetical protein
MTSSALSAEILAQRARSEFQVAPPHMPPVSAVRPGSVGSDTQLDVPDKFFTGHAPGLLLSVRDKFGRVRQAGMTPKSV